MIDYVRKHGLSASKTGDVLEADGGNDDGGNESCGGSKKQNDFFDMDDQETQEWRKKFGK